MAVESGRTGLFEEHRAVLLPPSVSYPASMQWPKAQAMKGLRTRKVFPADCATSRFSMQYMHVRGFGWQAVEHSRCGEMARHAAGFNVLLVTVLAEMCG